jgi:hypothetical protein
MSNISKLRLAVRRRRLTEDLARGIEPVSSSDHALRAAELTSPKSRKQLAKSYSRTLDEAHRRPPVSRMVIMKRGAVLEAEDAINSMIERLRSPDPVTPQGMAMADQILTASEWSPLYNYAEPGTLRRQVVITTEALDSEPPIERELAVAA